jgi:FkbM family methyltransferase
VPLTLRELLKKVPLARQSVTTLRSWRTRHRARSVFENPELYLDALREKGHGTLVLRTRDGLNVTIRRNVWDARIVGEIFFDKPYVRHLRLSPRPVVVDIGGYIGDFSIYAARYLDARRVVVYEPTVENFRILQENVVGNGYGDRIVAVNKAVSGGSEVTLNVDIRESEEVHVSAYWYPDSERRTIPSITLGQLLEIHGLDRVDLLKVDCEGAEYDILSGTPLSVYQRICNIVFEYHRINGFRPRLEEVVAGMRRAGYAVRVDRNIVSACRGS